MRYWVYINDKVDGPYDEEKLVSLDGFTPETLICSEEIEEGGSQEWVKASNIFEFDEASKTMTRAPLTQEELDTIQGKTADVTATSPVTQVPVADTSVTQILIEKIDNLTREIEGLKTKLDAALEAAAHSAPAAAPAPQPQPFSAPAPQPVSEPVNEDATITNTESLVNHAEQLVAQASSNPQAKPVDFLDEIEIGSGKTENLSEKGGEELILRSALDSLYNAKVQPEAEKEATFQDLLSSAKITTDAALPAQQPQPQTPAEEPAAQEPAAPQQTPDIVLSLDGEENKEQPQAPQQPPQPAVQAPGQPITEEKREEIINEITAPAQQNDLIAQAIQEAEQAEKPALSGIEGIAQTEEPQAPAEPAPAQEPSLSLPTADEPALSLPTADEPQAPAEPTPAQEPSLSLPTADEPALSLPTADEPQAPAEPAPMDLPAEKESLDLNLGDQPQLNIAQTEEPEQPVPAVADNAPAQTPFGGNVLSDAVTPMNPNEAVGGEQKEITETIKELVPGKKIEPQREDDGLISQADLAEAFTERTPTEEFPLPEETQSPAEEVESFQQETLAEAPAPQNPNDLTEVELKEGSTYLISDFIPPAQTSGAAAQSALPKEYGGAASEDKKEEEKEEAVEEILTSKKDEADLTVSKVILENTIKTKRGATMDIKTVPMVKEPGDSNRLDLTDSDLDINTQHDMKAADIKPGSSKGTKIVLGSAVSVIILALIYVMLGYLEILPPQFNFIKSSSSAQEQQALDEQLNEMLPQQPEQAPADMPQAMPQDYTQQMPQAGLQPGQQQMPAGAMQPGMPQQAYGQNAPMMPVQPAANPLDPILAQVQNFPLANGQTLQQLINSRHPAAQQMIEWNITTAVEPDNYSILVKIPPENPQSFKISYRFNYNTVTNTLDPTISDSKNLLDSVQAR